VLREDSPDEDAAVLREPQGLSVLDQKRSSSVDVQELIIPQPRDKFTEWVRVDAFHCVSRHRGLGRS
jgi:hypothetical protein